MNTRSKPRHPLDARAQRLLDEWVMWLEFDEANVGSPSSSWDAIVIAHAKQEARARPATRKRRIVTDERGQPMLDAQGRPRTEPIPGRTVIATETRPSGHSRVPPGVDEWREIDHRASATAMMMDLVGDVHPAYKRAVYACHKERGERAAADSMGIPRDQLRLLYSAGYALFLRELSGQAVASGGQIR